MPEVRCKATESCACPLRSWKVHDSELGLLALPPHLACKKENSLSGSSQVTAGLECCSDYLRSVLGSHRVPTLMVSF